MTADEPIPVVNNDNEHMEINEDMHINPDTEQMGDEDDTQAITGVNELDNMTNNNVSEQITGVEENKKGNTESLPE